MFAAFCAAACLAPAADPAPLPDRWLLQLPPDGLLQLPDRLYAATWYDDFRSRSGRLSWAVWVDFRRSDGGRPAEAVVTLAGGEAAVPPLAPLAPGHRSVPLAAHGPLVEFDGRLYTATLRPAKCGDPERAHDLLLLGSAVEVTDRVWYQAGTTTAGGGKTRVEEWRLEFRDDPRTAGEGGVTVRGHRRVVAAPGGESFAADLRFKAEGPDDRARARVVTLVPAEGNKPGRPLPYLVLGDEHRGSGDFIWVDGQDRLSLSPAPADARRRPDPPGLVQPPAKKPGK